MSDSPATSPDCLTFRQGYLSDRMARSALADLLSDIFDIDVSILDALGGWDPSCMPFGYFDEAGNCIANFSVFSMPMIVEGRSIRAAGFQSGAVRPNWRGRGLYRDLMRKAFAWCDDAGFEAGLLLTDKPGVYEPYGFRIVPQSRFVGPPPEREACLTPARAMSLQDPADILLARQILERRMPVSNRFSVVRQTEMFLLNSQFDPDIRLSYMPEAHAMITWTSGPNGFFRLFDIAAASIPSLATVLGTLRQTPTQVEVHFPTDRIGWVGAAQADTSSTTLMLRSSGVAMVDAPVMLSPMAAF